MQGTGKTVFRGEEHGHIFSQNNIMFVYAYIAGTTTIGVVDLFGAHAA